MSTTDGAIDQKRFYDLEWIIIVYYRKQLLYANETSAINKILFITLSLKQHNRYSSIINNLKYE